MQPFNTSNLKHYQLAMSLYYGDGDVYVGEGDTVNVEVRKKASTEETRKVYVSLIDADDKTASRRTQSKRDLVAEDATFFQYKHS